MTYYGKDLPEVGDIVFVTIKDFSERGTYCDLLEYGGAEGFILNTELDKRVFDPKKQFIFRKVYPMMVLSSTPKAIDLSYKKVRYDEREQLLNKFIAISKIKLLIDEFLFLFPLDQNTVYSLTLWKHFEMNHLDDPITMQYKFIKHPEVLMEHLIELYPDQSNEFIKDMKSRTTYTEMTIAQEFTLIVCDDDAITKLREILEYKDEKTEIVYVSSPRYQIVTCGDNDEMCNNQIQKCLDHLKKKIEGIKCSFKITDKHIVKAQDVSIKPINRSIC